MFRLQCDLQYYKAQIHKLEQERSPRSSHRLNSDEAFLSNLDVQPGMKIAFMQRALKRLIHDAACIGKEGGRRWLTFSFFL